MKISKNKAVSLCYELRLNGDNGEIIQTVDSNNPMKFIFGVESLIVGFERNIEGLKTGDNFSFLLPCEEAYGAAREELVLEIEKSSFKADAEIENDFFVEGKAIPMCDSEGNRLDGVVVEVKDNSVIMDFNHPLSDEDLFFSGTITDVREATAEEIQQKTIHCSPSSCGSCGGGCSA